MFSKVNSFGIHGVEGFPVTVEADVSDGLPSFVMVGYLSGEVREAQERVRTALKNSGHRLPPRRVTINLSPADIKKEGTAYDLAIAAAVLCSLGEISPENQEKIDEWAFIGELGLDGSVKPVPGVLSRVFEACRRGIKRVFLPIDNVPEGENIRNVEITGVSSVAEVAAYLRNDERIGGGISKESETAAVSEVSGQSGAAAVNLSDGGKPEELWDVDFDEIVGLPVVRRACEAAAAGKHNILFIGPAGTGKTMAARRLPTILPPMNLAECMEVSKIYSICGLLNREKPLIRMRPFRSPHHSITAQALAGGGRTPMPGEISLASRGVLFLDELAEFPPWLLDLLRQPMEEGTITVSRMGGTVSFPAAPLIAAAMNPCKCGFYPDLSRCRCTEPQIRRYLSRISGPFLDRMDLGVEVPRQDLRGAGKRRKGESSNVMRERILEARERQEERVKNTEFPFWNSQMNRSQIREFCVLTAADHQFLEEVCEKMGFSIRGRDKILRVARTLADLDGVKEIGKGQLSEAIAFRTFEQKYWSSL